MLTKKPISPSISGAGAAGDRACRRRCRPGRCGGGAAPAKAASSVMNSVAPSRRPRRRRRHASWRGRSQPRVAAAAARRGGPGPVGGQLQRRQARASCARPVVELRLEHLARRASARCQSGEVGVLDRQGRAAASGWPRPEGVVEAASHSRIRTPIDQPSETMWCIVSSKTCCARARGAAASAADERTAGQVEGPARLLRRASGVAAASAGPRSRERSTSGSAQRSARGDDLARLAVARPRRSCAAPRGGARSRPAPRPRAATSSPPSSRTAAAML